MRFSLPALALLASTALASPTDIVVRAELVSTDEVAESLSFAASASHCNILKCVEVVAHAACIVRDIEKDDVQGVVRCVKAGAKELCPCAACVKPLDKFLKKHHLCK